MTAWDLQLAANAHGKAVTTSAWMTAVFYRTKKLKPLDELIADYDSFKLGGMAAQKQSFDGIYHMMMALSKSQDSPAGGESKNV